MIRFYGEDELVIAFMNGSDNYHYFPIDTAGFRKRLRCISQHRTRPRFMVYSLLDLEHPKM